MSVVLVWKVGEILALYSSVIDIFEDLMLNKCKASQVSFSRGGG